LPKLTLPVVKPVTLNWKVAVAPVLTTIELGGVLRTAGAWLVNVTVAAASEAQVVLAISNGEELIYGAVGSRCLRSRLYWVPRLRHPLSRSRAAYDMNVAATSEAYANCASSDMSAVAGVPTI
jgi:hypothetical protein